jgi:hypothetical protein
VRGGYAVGGGKVNTSRLPAPLDVTLAFKHVALSKQLTGTEKQVATAILDTFNRRTGQCDPSFDRIAHLLQLSRRTVIRSVHAVERSRLLSKVRRGGNHHRNRYQPNWPLVRELEKRWTTHKSTKHWQPSAAKVSPWTVSQHDTSAGGEVGTQTIPNNLSLSTPLAGPAETSQLAATLETPQRQPRKDFRGRAFSSTVYASMRSARNTAEKRWNAQLAALLKDKPDLYAKVIDAVDKTLAKAATEAELGGRRR